MVFLESNFNTYTQADKLIYAYPPYTPPYTPPLNIYKLDIFIVKTF